MDLNHPLGPESTAIRITRMVGNPPMNGRPPARRRLTMLDLMLMVAAAALALAGFQFAVTHVFPGWLDYSRWPRWIGNPTPRAILYMLSDATAPLIPLAGAWTGLLLVLRMLPPRPPWRRIWRQPGMVACLAASFAITWAGAAAGLLLGIGRLFLTFQHDGLTFAQSWMVGHVFPLAGVAVASAWMPMRLSRRWPPPADWIDRAGRIVGVLWMTIGLAWTVRSYEPFVY